MEFKSHIYTPTEIHDQSAEVRDRTISPEGQSQIIDFVEHLRKEVGDRDSWEKTCKLADEELKQEPFDNEKYLKILNIFEPYINQMPAGHDPGHFYRDLISSVILYDSESPNASSHADSIAGLVGGSFHDIGVSIIPRFKDRTYGAGHAETGAFLFNSVSENILGENTRKLISYSISSHTNYLQPVQAEIPAGYTRNVYWSDVWADENQKLLGIGPTLTRCSDRLDTNGTCLLVRQIMCKFDSAQEGGYDLSGDLWVGINHDSLRQMMEPIVRDPISNPPTALEHVLNFARSNQGTIYSKFDHYTPKFQQLLKYKLNQINGMLNSSNHPEYFQFDSYQDVNEIKRIIEKISKAKPEKFDEAWNNYLSIWQELPPEIKLKWYSTFQFVDGSYQNLIEYFKQNSKDSQFKPVLDFAFKQLE